MQSKTCREDKGQWRRWCVDVQHTAQVLSTPAAPAYWLKLIHMFGDRRHLEDAAHSPTDSEFTSDMCK